MSTKFIKKLLLVISLVIVCLTELNSSKALESILEGNIRRSYRRLSHPVKVKVNNQLIESLERDRLGHDRLMNQGRPFQGSEELAQQIFEANTKAIRELTFEGVAPPGTLFTSQFPIMQESARRAIQWINQHLIDAIEDQEGKE